MCTAGKWKKAVVYMVLPRCARHVDLLQRSDAARKGDAGMFHLIKYIKEEMQIIRERDPAIKSSMEVFLYPSFKAILRYRAAHWLYVRGHYFWARWISQRAARKTGIEIHPGATIGKGLFIDHGHGVIIGETAVLGDNVTLYQGVTLGGTGKESGKRHPTVGNNVMISAGAKVLGSFKIGDNSKIGAGSVVLKEVPPNSTVVGIPGRVVRRRSEKAPQVELNQTDLPDLVSNDLAEMSEENRRLRHQLFLLCSHCRQLHENDPFFQTMDKLEDDDAAAIAADEKKGSIG